MALKAAIELDIFSAIAEGADSVSAIASRIQATLRGIRILCDYLVVIGFLSKHGEKYALTPESAMFLDRRSPAFLGSMARFLTLPEILDHQKNLAEIIRKGHPTQRGGDVLETENPMWVEFARSMVGNSAPVCRSNRRNPGCEGRSEMESARHRRRSRNFRRDHRESESERGNFRPGLALRACGCRRKCARCGRVIAFS